MLLHTLLALAAGLPSAPAPLRSAPPPQEAAPPVLRLPAVFADRMVLQQQEPVRLWGWAAPDKGVAVHLARESAGVDGSSATTRADPLGAWEVSLPARAASDQPHRLTVRAGEEELVFHDVLFGEVWLCAGQSNMVWRMQSCIDFEEARSAPIDPRIRVFTAPPQPAWEPEEDLPGTWTVAGPETLGSFSATAWHFGQRLAAELDVPVGLVVAAWGGSSVEAWTRLPALQATPAAARVLDDLRAYEGELRADPREWTAPGHDDSGWEQGELPATFAGLGHDLDGVLWFRRSVEIPEAWAGRALRLELGAIDDEDATWFQGARIGRTSSWEKERSYTVPAARVSSGAATIAVRVRDGAGRGGFWSGPEKMRLFPDDEEAAAVSLAGTWRFRVASTVPPADPRHRPGHLADGMLHPLHRLAMRGLVWYQGENNAMRGRAWEYAGLFPAFLADLRAHFGRPAWPVYFVQLPNFGYREGGFWDWVTLREGQRAAWEGDPHTGMAVTIDVGDAGNIHPGDKRQVGARLARWALARTYGRDDVVPSGPRFRAGRLIHGVMRLEFDLFGARLATRDGGPPRGFVVAGADRVFHPAEAELNGDTVLVRAAAVPQPRSVRYAWSADPASANLVNADGLPASPFRTDDWPLGAAPARTPVPRDPRWLAYAGGEGAGAGKRVVLVAGDEEYRSEEALPALARLMAERHGFECVVLFSQDPETGAIDPEEQTHIPGMHLLDEADLLVLFLRFRELPDDDMTHIVRYLESGRPVIGLRTSTHAFRYRRDPGSPHAPWSWNSADPAGGFGRAVFGETWVAHHGDHGSESTRGVLEPGSADHPVLRGVEDVWGPTDVYAVRALPDDATILLRGAVLAGMRASDPPVAGPRNDPMMPLAWIREIARGAGTVQRVFCTTMGASQDLESAHLRRLLVQAACWAVGQEDRIPAAGADARLVGPYEPSPFGFGRHRTGLRPNDLALGVTAAAGR